MVLPKSRNNVGLGRAIQADFTKARKNRKGGLKHTTEFDPRAKKPALRSVTQESNLDEFLSTAELGGVDFVAEKQNVKVIQNPEQNPFLPTVEEAKQSKARQEQNKDRLTIPRRPHWNESTTPEELDRMEKEAFLEWRRSLAQLQEVEGFVVTPFERNLQIWRQLWRVIERSDVVVQIVDARHPLFFRSANLEHYVQGVDPKKKNFLLVNKADMLTTEQRKWWAAYFNQHNISYLFFSARLAAESNMEEAEDATGVPESLKASETHTEDHRIATLDTLLGIFETYANNLAKDKRKLTFGLVGYPNVGKSSTINALVGHKTVSVSSTPGKTKHFQTINLTDKVTLLDCPGLVFPSFATTQADLVLDGVLPIDQMREHTGPSAMLAQRIPKEVLENIYTIRIRTRPKEEGGSGVPSAEEVLFPYARARGYMRSNHGTPDDSRASRILLKDYVNGKLIYVHPPPNYPDSDMEFNKEHHINYLSSAAEDIGRKLQNITMKDKLALRESEEIDKEYFSENPHVRSFVRGTAAADIQGIEYKGRNMTQSFQRRLNDDGTPKYPMNAQGKPLSRRKARQISTQEVGVSPDAVLAASSKKHNKKNKRTKQRSGRVLDDF
ncbi:GTP binding protein [Schizosaccharomyces cryophilus OY26]|uniref:GTP binding protein n=1 Tax=Schizosaccharomyces cryophilus (strain OY26 / ATCC MYA-4695 / CBS 11777 / NBRC 106824 / NRRL Y48691) TaxID=653667 RepID=S9XHV3_SCHCR|nr:GTP binding protein [Schizosaccharomyces cryophilus OY26]EPY53256.1 GTP binding protein [Schizosaccharomyces cryophilus OY26]